MRQKKTKTCWKQFEYADLDQKLNIKLETLKTALRNQIFSYNRDERLKDMTNLIKIENYGGE